MPPPITLKGTRWDWSRPYVLGIVNVTPDSFSDGGRFAGAEAAIAHGRRLIAEGADAVDVGGESTRPGAARVSVDEEIARVVPVVRALASSGALVSIDTTKVAVARAAFEAGALILNDVSMGDARADLVQPVIAAGGAYILMHSRGTPGSMVQRAQYEDVVADVSRELASAARELESAGLGASRIIVDPGIGFAKRASHSLSLLANVATLRGLGYAVCVGPSRKSFIDATEAYGPSWGDAPAGADSRVGGTAAAVALSVSAGAEIIRVHDVAIMRQVARVAHAIRECAGGAARSP